MNVVYIYADTDKVHFYFDRKEFTEINLVLFLSLIFYISKILK